MTPSEQARADTRECSACGGTGCEKRIDHWHASYRYGECRERCIVCLGAGRISDRMSVADALADAETLRRVAVEIDPSCAQRLVSVQGLWIVDGFPHAGIAALGAHNAFCAVPGLRDE